MRAKHGGTETGRQVSVQIRIFILVVLLAAFVLRVYRIDDQSLWVDEGYGVDFASQDIQRMLDMWLSWKPDAVSVVVSGLPENEIAAATDTHAPLHYLLLHYWMRLAGRSEFAVRFLSMFFSLLAVPLLFTLGRQLLGRRAGLYAAALGAASPFYVAYAQEARMYSMSLLFSLISVYLMVRIIRRSYGAAHLAGYVLSTALALYTHYFTALVMVFENIFVVSSLAAYVAVRRLGKCPPQATQSGHSARRTALSWLLSQVAVLLLLLPWVGIILKQTNFPKNEALPVPSVLEVISWYWQSLNAATQAVPQGIQPYLTILAAGTTVLLVARSIVDPQSRQTIAMLLLYLSIPLALTIVILQDQPMFHPRYLIVASPAYYLLLTAALAGLRRLNALLPHFACAVVVIIFAAGLNSYYFDSSFAKDDARATAQFLTGDSSADDLVVLDYPEPIGHYYKGKAPYVFVPGDPAVALKTLNELGPGRRNIFYVHWWQSRSDPAGYVSYLLSREGKEASRSEFRGFTVQKYEMPKGLTGFADDSRVREMEVNFDGLLKLQAVEYGAVHSGGEESGGVRALRQGGKLWVALRWKLLQETSEVYKAFVHLESGVDRIVGQSDRYLLKGQLRTDKWKAGDTFTTYHLIPLLPGTPPGSYQVSAGLYEESTQRRASIVGKDLVKAGTSTRLGTVDVARFPEALAGAFANALAAKQLGVARVLDTEMGSIRLVGHTLSGRDLAQGDRLRLTLLWRADRDVHEEYTFRLEATPKGAGQGSQLPKWFGSSYPTNKWIKDQLIREWTDFQVPMRFAPGKYMLMGRVTRGPDETPVGAVDLGEIEVRARPFNTAIPGGIHRVSAQFGDVVDMIGYELASDSSKAGDITELTLYWQAQREMDKDFTVFTHLLDGAIRVRAQHDGSPADGTRPTRSWRAGEIVADKHRMTVDKNALPGEYVLEVGLYDATSGERLPATSRMVEIMGNAALIGKVTIRQ